MTPLKAFLYTLLFILIWGMTQLALLVPIKLIFGIPDDFTHLFGSTKIISMAATFAIIYKFIWKPKWTGTTTNIFSAYNPILLIYLVISAVGLFLWNRPFWDFESIILYFKGSKLRVNSFTTTLNVVLIYKIIATIFIGPIVEELLFRKFLLEKLVQQNSRIVSLITSSFCFSIIHLETPNNLIPSFIAGLVFGYVFIKTKRIGYAIFMHAVANIIVLIDNIVDFPSNNCFFGYNFDAVYWLMVAIGIVLIAFGLKQIHRISSN